MKILMSNVNLNSSTGPNHFAKKLKKYVAKNGYVCDTGVKNADAELCFIERHTGYKHIPLIQRLDGIYFDSTRKYQSLNAGIINTYQNADAVIFQSEFSQQMAYKYFGEHKRSKIIHNGADLKVINEIPAIEDKLLDTNYEMVYGQGNITNLVDLAKGDFDFAIFENIEMSDIAAGILLCKETGFIISSFNNRDCLLIAGIPSSRQEIINHERVIYLGHVDRSVLLSIYKRSKYFIHLARYDACPNVVVEARASGCEIICTSMGGTKEVAGPNAKIILEDDWDMNPLDVNSPPDLDFSRTTKNTINSNIDMDYVAAEYLKFILSTRKE